jgi:predicted ATPase
MIGRGEARVVRRVLANERAPSSYGSWPASIPAVAQLLRDGLALTPGVTLLVGENGSGKSTLVEGLAMAFGLAAEGGSSGAMNRTHESESPLHSWLTWNVPRARLAGGSSCVPRRCTASTRTWPRRRGARTTRRSTR